MIFPNLRFENIVQVNDKFRLFAGNTFSTPDEEITNILVRPEAVASFIPIFNSNDSKRYLDYAYSTLGNKTITLRVVSDQQTLDIDYELSCLSEEQDKLFSDDNDLFPYEPDVFRYLPPGKNSFKYAHREAQTKIVEFLDEQRIWKRNNKAFTKEDLIDITEFRRWSLFQTLLIIFESSQLNVGDIFQEKREQYEKDMRTARNRASIRLDVDGDGVIDEQPVNIRTTMLVRR